MSIQATGESDPAERGGWAERAEARMLAEALRLAPEHGWTWRMTKAAGAASGLGLGETELLLPNGPRDLAALLSRACEAAAAAHLERRIEGVMAFERLKGRVGRFRLGWRAAEALGRARYRVI